MNDDQNARIEATTARLEAWCSANGHWVSPDGRCQEATAAAVLGIVPGTLRNLRCEGNAPTRFYLIRGRVSYSLHDLAAHIEDHRV